MYAKQFKTTALDTSITAIQVGITLKSFVTLNSFPVNARQVDVSFFDFNQSNLSGEEMNVTTKGPAVYRALNVLFVRTYVQNTQKNRFPCHESANKQKTLPTLFRLHFAIFRGDMKMYE